MALNWDAVIRDAWTDIQDAVAPCLVGLCWSDQLIEPKDGQTEFERYDVQPRLASGCILDVRGKWFFLTAGHVLDTIFETIPKVGRKVMKVSLVDGMHKPGRKAEHIPIPFGEENVYRFYDKEITGLDYGLVHISPLIRATLASNGVRCVTEEIVAGVDETFDGYVLVGFPGDEFRVKMHDTPTRRDANIFIGIAWLPVEGLVGDEIPEQYRDRTGNLFVGQILSLRGHYVGTGQSVELETIEGMSGGPIFGLRVMDDGFQLGLVAVQSTWFKRQRVMGASRVGYLTKGINRFLEERGSTPR